MPGDIGEERGTGKLFGQTFQVEHKRGLSVRYSQLRINEDKSYARLESGLDKYSSADLVAHLNAQARGVAGRAPDRPAGIAPESKDAAIKMVVARARPGDVVLSMGARDPALGEFAKRLLKALETR
jgi:hypothetical protein